MSRVVRRGREQFARMPLGFRLTWLAMGALVIWLAWLGWHNDQQIQRATRTADRRIQQVTCEGAIERIAGGVGLVDSIANAVLTRPGATEENSGWIRDWREQERRRIVDGMDARCEMLMTSDEYHAKVRVKVAEQARRYPAVDP
jgi:hypothetical protein